MKLFGKVLGFLLLLSISLFCHAEPSSQKAKRIYITLDVSGSMRGNKYVMANYAAQVISVFSNTNDLVYLYYLGSKHELGSSNGYKAIQIPYQNLPSRKNTYSEISDLTGFVNSYHPDPNYQDWLFIVGDGDWDYNSAKGEYDSTIEKLKNLLRKEQLQVCYLQTGETVGQEFAFTRFLLQQNSPFVDVRKSDTSASSVLENCIYFTNKILGFSNMSVGLQPAGDSCVSFSSEFPLERCLLVCQSDKETTKDLQILSVECSGSVVNVSTKGNPSTKPLVDEGPVLSGVVWELNSLQTIPANETVKVRFNQKIDSHSLTLYPYVDVAIAMHPWSVNMDTLFEPKPNCFQICDKENRVLVKINITDRYGRKFQPPLMQKMNVKFVTSGTEISASYSSSDTTFSALLPMPDDTVSYLSVVESPGYFIRFSLQQNVMKSGAVCPPDKVPMIELPVQRFGPITFSELKNGESFGGPIDDSLFREIVYSGIFDVVSIQGHDSWMLENASVTAIGDVVTLTQKPISGLCECAFPDSLRYEVVLKSNNGILHDGKLYEGFRIPIVQPIGQRTWWNRCWVYVAMFAGILLFLLYLRAIRKKHRFAMEARVKAVVMDEWGNEKDRKYCHYLRKKGFLPWLLRWFWPADEKNTLSYVNPRVKDISFKAAATSSTILVPTENVDFRKLKIGDYNPEEGKLKFVKLGDNETIDVQKEGENKEGYLQYISGGKNDGSVFRSINIILTLAALAAEAFVVWVLIKSLIIMVQ